MYVILTAEQKPGTLYPSREHVLANFVLFLLTFQFKFPRSGTWHEVWARMIGSFENTRQKEAIHHKILYPFFYYYHYWFFYYI
jgi:hypothetical protein